MSRSNYFITVESAGPNKTFEEARAVSTDDFNLWTSVTDYFTEARGRVDSALDKHLRAAGRFPQTEASLREVLRKGGINYEELRDGWGRTLYAAFGSEKVYADRVQLEKTGEFEKGAGAQRTQIKPVTQTVSRIELRSAGGDGKAGTSDDFSVGYFTSIADERAAGDESPQAVSPLTTFSGGTGAITGTVKDPSDAVIPGAVVTATHKYTELEFETTTNDEGVYLIRNLPSGIYTLSFSSPGFTPTTITDVRVQSSNLTTANAALNVGATSETVTVTAAETATINQTSAQVSEVVEKAVGPRPQLSTPRLREFFPETLVWQPELTTDAGGRAQLKFKLADNITTWKMSVIASTEDGQLGTFEKEFQSFQPFFVEHDPPRILTEGDEISLPVVLRNYLERAQGVDLEIKPEPWFTLTGPARQRAEVASGDAARPTFDFRAVASVNDGKQRITASGSDAGDAIEKPVTVHPDGEERTQTSAAVFGEAGALDLKVPAGLVAGSLRGELKIYPNLAAHVLEGIEGIMQRPYGCGEQTISSAYPSVLVLNYAEASGRGIEPRVAALARRYTREGYERLLGYRAPEGGFTYWGRGDPDLALTAYALRFLTDASGVIEVDEGVVKETREWLVRQQRDDGSWAGYNWGGAEDTRRTALTTAYIARVLARTSKGTLATEHAPAGKAPNGEGSARRRKTSHARARRRRGDFLVARNQHALLRLGARGPHRDHGPRRAGARALRRRREGESVAADGGPQPCARYRRARQPRPPLPPPQEGSLRRVVFDTGNRQRARYASHPRRGRRDGRLRRRGRRQKRAGRFRRNRRQRSSRGRGRSAARGRAERAADFRPHALHRGGRQPRRDSPRRARRAGAGAGRRDLLRAVGEIFRDHGG
ncbi:MAG: carboxypeptidase regulatory-like domain-containing protein [Acidobacteria bacterium]|nr:carboxypeptidase regulatory-like domain-containing protein [Acidobacteriota bacterium]